MRYGFLVAIFLSGCLDLNGSSWGGPGEPCYTNAPRCDKGLTCGADGVCRSIPPDLRPTCTLSTDCDETDACDNGRCTPYAANCAADTDCRPDYYCASQVCVRKLTGPIACDHDSQCGTGYCSDGLCCDTACTGPCQACAAAKTNGKDGTCISIPAGSDPDNECPNDTTCSGSSACSLKPLGAVCTAGAECASSYCSDGVCCDGACDSACHTCTSAGACVAVHNAEDPGSCDDTNRGPSCAQAPCICDNAGDCKSGGGTACTGTADCAGGRFCVDSVCCDTTCGGVCNSCLSSQTHGSTGTCAPIAAGLDPDNECAGPTACNGASSCYASAQGSSCSHGYECTTGVCDSERIYDKDFAEYVTVGTCCDRECPDGCTSCRGVGTGGVAAGTCATIVRNSDPDAACATVVSGHVLQLSLCDGHGACQLQNGATCTLNDQCRSDNCQYAACGGPVECQDHGTCQ